MAGDQNREQRIRERAYQIWLKEGQPYGHCKEHWARAEEKLAEEENAKPETQGTEAPLPGPYENIG